MFLLLAIDICFNSRSREGSDFLLYEEDVGVYVSIHAPARGATPTSQLHILHGKFQFTLPRGERLRVGGSHRRYDKFQFTLPRGERHQMDRVIHDRFVSIHAPARGATLSMPGHSQIYQFQFTLPRGERQSRAS